MTIGDIRNDSSVDVINFLNYCAIGLTISQKVIYSYKITLCSEYKYERNYRKIFCSIGYHSFNLYYIDNVEYCSGGEYFCISRIVYQAHCPSDDFFVFVSGLGLLARIGGRDV